MVNVRKTLTLDRRPFGKTDGKWFVRIPLWLQATIVIFVTGCLSLLVLTVVAAIKTWQYSEQLMSERLSNFAAMIALQIEEDFGEVQTTLTSVTSAREIIEAVEAADKNQTSLKIWSQLESQLEFGFSELSILDEFVLYNRNASLIYSYSKPSGGLPGPVSFIPPQSLLPLSNASLVDGIIRKMDQYDGGIISDSISVMPGYKGRPSSNMTYSVSRGIPFNFGDFYGLNPSQDGYGPVRNNSDWAGFCTFTLTSTFDYVQAQLFNKYEVIAVPQSLITNSSFTYLADDDIYGLSVEMIDTITDFPAVKEANRTVNRLLNRTASGPGSNPYASTPNSTYVGHNETGGGSSPQNPGDSGVDDKFGTLNFQKKQRSGSLARRDQKTKRAQVKAANRATNLAFRDTDKKGWAIMRTRGLYNTKASVGYSWAFVMDQTWIVFIQIAQSEAFHPAVHLRNVVIGVGVGILGAVVLIMAPLSRWHTRGVYLIYQNMRLRPMLLSYEENGDTEDFNGSGKTLQVDGSPNESPDGSEHQESATSSQRSQSSVEELKIKSHSFNMAGRVPAPLPPLNRLFTDEFDELVFEYNNLVDRLNNQYLHLEDQVRQRTQEAQKARELTEEANNAKSEFIAIISHELRTPLNGILGLTSVSVEEDDTSKIKNSLGHIIESGKVLMELLNELLELSKSLVGVEPLVRAFTAANLLETLPSIFQSRSSDVSVTFALAAIPSDLNDVELRGDIDHVVQICVNFMSNAMKFSESNGTVSVILHMRPLSDPNIRADVYKGALDGANAVLEILVTDSGVGMTPSQLAKIFDLFVQGDDPLRKNHRGAGLGMALSKQLAEGIGGYVVVFSANHVGSTVVLRVPVECMNRGQAEVESLNGPPIEFKVRDVYTTSTLHPGKVELVEQVRWTEDGSVVRPSPTPSFNAATVPFAPLFSGRRARHSYQSSSGSKMLLTRAHPVTKVLKSHHNHHHHQLSHSTAFASLNSDSSATQTQDEQGDLPHPGDVASRQHKNNSSTSLLLVVPPAIDEASASARSRHSWYSLDPSASPPVEGREPSPARGKQKLTLMPSSTQLQGLDRPSSVHHRELGPFAPSTGLSIEPPSVTFITSTEPSPATLSDIDLSAKILVVEDNPLNSQIMVKMLKQLGLEDVSVADNGESAIQMVENSIVGGYHFSIIFMDISMPLLNGIDATQFIRTTLGYPYPIIALTGYSDVQSRNAILAVNIQEVLTKPIMKNDIARVLVKYVRGGFLA